jgi:hypothetical protein
MTYQMFCIVFTSDGILKNGLNAHLILCLLENQGNYLHAL